MLGIWARDREHRHAATVTIEQSVDQMKVAGSTAAGADRQLARKVGLRAGGERRGFLVAHVNPADLSKAAKQVAKAIEAVAHYAVNAFHANLGQR